MAQFKAYCVMKQCTGPQQVSAFFLCLKVAAHDWYMGLPATEKVFETRYKAPTHSLWARVKAFHMCSQTSGQSAADFISQMLAKSQGLELADKQVLQAVICGLKPALRTFVVQNNPKDLAKLPRWPCCQTLFREGRHFRSKHMGRSRMKRWTNW